MNLEQNVYQCFHAKCAAKGDVLDLWSALQGMPLREAAVNLVQIFGLEPVPRKGTEKRNG